MASGEEKFVEVVIVATKEAGLGSPRSLVCVNFHFILFCLTQWCVELPWIGLYYLFSCLALSFVASRSVLQMKFVVLVCLLTRGVLYGCDSKGVAVVWDCRSGV